MIRFSFDFRSLRARLVLALLAILVLTAVSIGLPILWLVNSQPLHRVTISEMQVWQVLLGGAALVALIAVVIGLFLARGIAAPLERLTLASESIGRGDLGTPVGAWDDVTELAVLAGTLEDMRRRLRSAYDDLARSKEWADNLIASLVEGVFTLDSGGTLTSFSPGAERILGWRATDVVGRSADAVFQAAPVKDSPPGTIIRQSVTTRQGARIVLLITSGAVTRHSVGRTEQAFVMRDVTQEEESLRLREFFLANVSHELKTPLSSLRASIELLASEQDSLTRAERSELISSLWLGTIRLEELVDNLLSSASIRSGHFQINARPIEIEPILEELSVTCKPLLSLREQTLELELPPSVPRVLADPRRLSQVLVNLVSNAGKYGPPASPITITVETRGQMVTVNVIDRGQTIPPEERAGLFQPFTHSDTGASSGVGLGLSIVHSIVGSQGGEVGVKAAPGGGNIFWFTLCRAQAEPAARPKARDSVSA